MAIDHAVGGPVILAASSLGFMSAAAMGPLNFSMSEIGTVSLLAAMGAVARTFLDAKQARDRAAAGGIERDKLPSVDVVALGYALIGAPVMGSIALALVRAVGFLPDYAAVPTIMCGGYLGRDGINWAISVFQSVISRRTGDGK